MNVSARMIITLNIEHFRDLLSRESDPLKRKTIAGLLAEEESKLASLRSNELADEQEAVRDRGSITRQRPQR